MTQIRKSILVASVSMFMAMSPSAGPLFAETTPTETTDVAVVVSEQQIADVAAACAAGPESAECMAALSALVDALTAANPNVSLSTIIGSIAAQIASQSNAAISGALTIDATALGAALSALSSLAGSKGLTDLVATLLAVAENVTNGISVDLGAIASGSGISIGDVNASPG